MDSIVIRFDSPAIRLIPWPWLGFSSFVHSNSRGMILYAPSVGWPCFAFPRWREISASIAIFFMACEPEMPYF